MISLITDDYFSICRVGPIVTIRGELEKFPMGTICQILSKYTTEESASVESPELILHSDSVPIHLSSDV